MLDIEADRLNELIRECAEFTEVMLTENLYCDKLPYATAMMENLNEMRHITGEIEESTSVSLGCSECYPSRELSPAPVRHI